MNSSARQMSGGWEQAEQDGDTVGTVLPVGPALVELELHLMGREQSTDSSLSIL